MDFNIFVPTVACNDAWQPWMQRMRYVWMGVKRLAKIVHAE